MSFNAVELTAQDSGNALDLQKKLHAVFTLTGITADRSNIVTAGSVLVLHLDGLVMTATTAPLAPVTIYKGGRLQQSSGNLLRGLLSGNTDGSTAPKRTFVTGEKCWLTAINVQSDGVALTVYSDPFDDVRYYGTLKFPFPKNAAPPADSLMKSVSEVITVDGGGDQNQQASALPLPNIAPPPPPADQPPPPPKMIALGQTKPIVIATWGQPKEDIKLASKEIFVYPDMKVTFVAGKVSDVK
jgi:hypothetical protein